MIAFRWFIFILMILPFPAQSQPDLEQATAATFRVFSDDRSRQFLGSAFLWHSGAAQSRQVVSNAHVVKDHARVLLQTPTGAFLSATVVRRDQARDLALIVLDTPRPGGFAPRTTPTLFGMPVVAIGAPLGLPVGISRGHVSNPKVFLEPQTPFGFIRHDAAVNPGSSGGPLLDDTGALLGMNSQIADGSRLFVGIAYAIPAPVIAAFVADRLKPLPVLGLQLRPVTPLIAHSLGVEVSGVLIDHVQTQGAAAQAGLAPGDIILAIDGTPIRHPADISQTLDRRSGDRVTLDIWRAGERHTAALATNTPPLPTPARTQPTAAPVPMASLGMELGADGTILSIDPNGLGYQLGLATGDRILALNGQSISLFSDLPVAGVFRLNRYGETTHLPFDRATRSKKLRVLGGGNFLDPEVITF